MKPSTPPVEPLLRVQNLEAWYRVRGQPLRVLCGLDFSIQSGEIVGILGESGCGKTTTALAILGLMPAGAAVTGSARFRDSELIGASEDVLRKVRGAQISLVLQEPALSLNPVIRVLDQVAEVVRAHGRQSAAGCRDAARSALDQVGLNTSRLQTSYPHQLSGGQRQRVLLAQAIVCGPSLIIADEPTGSLDPAAQAEILTLLRDLANQPGRALLIITHDPRVAAVISDRVIVLYAGRIVESGKPDDVLTSPWHPYTRGLMACLRDPTGRRLNGADRHLPAIPGSAPEFQRMPPGCTFEPRCHDRMRTCVASDPPISSSGSREVRCFLYGHG